MMQKFIMKAVLAALFTALFAGGLSAQTTNTDRQTTAPDILIADFEDPDYGDWTVTGQAFGAGPARGTLANQMQVTGFEGRGLVNSFHHGDASTGTLTSPEFTIQRPYINFLIGGGGYPDWTCMNLLADGRIVRTAVGPNIDPGGTERLAPQSWDVRGLAGQTVRIQIIDRHTGGWGHINVDHLVQSAEPHPVRAVKDRRFAFERRYLNFPVKNGAPRRLVRLYLNGELTRELTIELAPGEPDFWVFLDVSQFEGQPGTLRLYRYDTAADAGFDAVHQDDSFPGENTLYREKLRPQFHFTSRRGWINDTNGMVWHDGEYHLFYQHDPFIWSGRDKYWGHAVSTDMVYWRELPEAIYPYELGAIWSGSAVVDHTNTAGFQTGTEKPIVAFYTTAGGTTPSSLGQPFTQSISCSNDRGRTWTHYTGNPVIDHISGANRDPKVFWHGESGRWVMVLFWEDRMMGFFTSPDLKNWTKQSELKSFHECPELFELPVDGDPSNSKWILYGASGDYLIGAFDGARFVPETDAIRFQYGNCFYASQTFNNMPGDDGRRVQMAWGQVTMPDMPFNQMILFPVSLTLHTTPDGIRMFAEPVTEIESLHRQHWAWTNTIIRPGDDNPLTGITGELFRIRAEIIPSGADACQLVIRGVPVTYDVAARRLSCRDKSAPLAMENGKIRLEVLVDRMSIEIFANDGRIYMPIGVNLADNPRTLELTSTGGPTRIQNLDINELNSIWF